jgi:hypothetical protein
MPILTLSGIAILSIVIGLSGCTSVRTTSPARTATEELLISTAAERAAEKLAAQIPANLRIYLNTVAVTAPDVSYATLAIEDRLLRKGDTLVLDKTEADAVIEVRAGALSTDEHSMFIGIPSLVFPATPGASTSGLPVPSIDFFKRSEAKAIAKFAATAFDPKTGRLVFATPDYYGTAQKVDWAVLLFFSWTDQDYEDGSKEPR